MKMNKKIWMLVIVMILIGLSVAWAADESKSRAKDKRGSSSKVEKVLRIKEVEIKGEVKKPQAVFFLPRSKFTMDDMIVTESFIENITNVVDKE